MDTHNLSTGWGLKNRFEVCSNADARWDDLGGETRSKRRSLNIYREKD